MAKYCQNVSEIVKCTQFQSDNSRFTVWDIFWFYIYTDKHTVLIFRKTYEHHLTNRIFYDVIIYANDKTNISFSRVLFSNLTSIEELKIAP